MASEGFDLVARGCISCPPAPPPCPACASDEQCTIQDRSCDTCAETICVKSASSGNDSSSGGKSNAGAIAGGVIGGVAFVAILTFLVYWFCIRKKRKEYEQQYSEQASEKRSTVGANRQARQSTRSIASTVLTRASNVIQIAYIPGVTNRSPPETPSTLVPPVPPVPVTPFNSARNSTLLSPHYAQDQHFFMPGDIRDSTYSGMSDGTRNSITPSLARSSVATTIYGNNAIVSPMPAQQALRGKPAMVSVRSGTSTPVGNDQAPAVPMITQAQLNKADAMSPRSVTSNQSSIVARTMVARPVNVKGSSHTKVPTIAEDGPSTAPAQNPPNTPVESPHVGDSTFDDSSSDGESLRPRRYGDTDTTRKSTVPTVIEDSPAVKQSPFADSQADAVTSGSSTLNPTSAAQGSSHRHRGSLGSNRALDDATSDITPESNNGKRSSMGTAPSPLSASRSLSPFSDENEVQKS
ncbi:hypothetical protein FQN54_002665 [Arachnomyces sp. PD_36]|nr:hypothetical protein FQN54_002665 [Arachnomyces sp. PD_36]